MTRALARLTTDCDSRAGGRVRTRIRQLRSGWPLMLRSTLGPAPGPISAWASRYVSAAYVHLTAGGAGPVGGDQLRLQVHVGAGSSLVLGEVSPTVLLPGPRGEQSRMDVEIHVGAGATLAWLPQLVIAAHGCRHCTDIHIALDPQARLLARDEVLFGRHGEEPGELRQRLRIKRAARPLYDQELAVGPSGIGWGGPAVTAGHRCAGSLLVIDPGLPWDDPHTDPGAGDDAAVMELPGSGILASALASDTTTLRRRLDAALASLADQSFDGRGQRQQEDLRLPLRLAGSVARALTYQDADDR